MGSILIYISSKFNIISSFFIIYITIIIFSILYSLFYSFNLEIDAISPILYSYFIFSFSLFLTSKKETIKIKINHLKKKKKLLLFSILILITSFLFQIIWSFKSPDCSGYYITAINLIENNSLDVKEPLLLFSDGFIRKLFYKSSETTMRIQYPIGSVFLLAFFMKYGVFWRIFFVYNFLILFLNLYYFFELIKKKGYHQSTVFLVLFFPQIIILLTTGVGMDLIGLSLAFLTLNYSIQFFTEKKLKFLIMIIFSFLSLALVKTSVFIFTIIIDIFLGFYILVINEEKRNKIILFFSKYKKILIITFSLGFLMILSGLLISLSGYFQHFSIIIKLTNIFRYPSLTFQHFFLNIIQILIIYLPSFLLLYNDKKNKGLKISFSFPLIIFSLFFIFFWNSSNFYPFDIGSRYFLPIGILLFLFHIYKQNDTKINLKKSYFSRNQPKNNKISNLNILRKKIFKFKYLLKDFIKKITVKINLKNFCIIWLLLLNSIFITHMAILDFRNQNFMLEVNKRVDNNSIIITNYYSKLFTDNPVYIIELYHGVVKEEQVVSEITELLNKKYFIYFIPQGVDSYDRIIINNFHIEKIYEYPLPELLQLIQDLLNVKVFDPAPRIIYRVSSKV